MKERPDVDISICMVTYNQKKYVEEAIDSYLTQKTSYHFEILVGDDASPDGTGAYVKQIYSDPKSPKYSEKVIVYDRTTNVGLSVNLYELYLQARGKYIYGCAGDDYACSEMMLEKLGLFLDANPEYASVSNWTKQVDAEGNETGENTCENTEYTLEDWITNRSTAKACGTGMVRNYFRNSQEDITYLYKCCRNNEEIPIWALQLEHGRHYVIHEKMLAYRYVNVQGNTNYNSTHKAIDKFEDYFVSLLNLKKYHPNHYYDMKEIMIANDFLKPIILTKDIRQWWKFVRLLGIRRVFRLIKQVPYLWNHPDLPEKEQQMCIEREKKYGYIK